MSIVLLFFKKNCVLLHLTNFIGRSKTCNCEFTRSSKLSSSYFPVPVYMSELVCCFCLMRTSDNRFFQLTLSKLAATMSDIVTQLDCESIWYQTVLVWMGALYICMSVCMYTESLGQIESFWQEEHFADCCSKASSVRGYLPA